MSFISSIMGRIAERLGLTVQGEQQYQRVRDYSKKGTSYSIESEISEKLAGLTVMLSSMPISGDTERAAWLDGVSDEFFRTKITKMLSTAYLTGDCLVVPAWTGRGMQNLLISSDDFAILQMVGDEITACAYVIDHAKKNSTEYQLLQAIELVPYTANNGEKLYANRYRMFVAQNWQLTDFSLSDFQGWEKYEADWVIPNVDRLLIGRFKSFTVNPLNLNGAKGVPICFGASQPIKEIRYLLDAMHDEFNLSEKFIMADKRLFKKEWKGDESYTVLPKGKERVFMDVVNHGATDVPIHDWSPDIRYNAYLDALDKQEQLLERAVGVSRGIISSPNNINYQNVDNVRKSQQATIAFIDSARNVAEHCLTDLVYAWNVLANFYDITPIGDYSVSFDWSDDYIETFSDRQNAILAGSAIGATDAADYRQFLFDESPEAARDRVAEIKANAEQEFSALTLEAVV